MQRRIIVTHAVRDDDDDVVRDDDAEQTLTPAIPLLLELCPRPALAGLVKNLLGCLASSCHAQHRAE
jgi:hypothetical protein